MTHQSLFRARGAAFWGVVLAALLIVPRVIDLGTVLTVDEPLWQARAARFIEGIATGDPAKTFASGQPGVITMWLAGLATPWKSLAASQAAVAMSVTIATLLSLGLLAKLTNPGVAIVGGIFMALDPFFIAHSRIVHTDALLASFMLLALLALLLWQKTEQRRYLVYGSIGTALAILTKLFGVALLVPAFLLLCAPAWRSLIRRTDASLPFRGLSTAVRPLLLFGVVLLLTVGIVWPALTFTPRVPLAFMAQRVSLHSQSAPIGRGGGDPWYYPREFLRRLTPVTTVLGAVAVAGIAVGNGKRAPLFPGRFPLMVLLGTGMFYAVALSLSEQKSDRYLLYAHLAADLAAGGALLWLASLLERSLRLPRRFGTLLLTGAAAVLLLNDLVQLHPRYIAHWNELVPVPENAKFGWGEGLEEAAAYLHETDVPRERLRISSYYPGALRHFLPGVHVERFTSYTDPSYQFAVLYRSMYGREEASPESAAVRDFLGSQPAEGSLVTVDDARFRLEKRILVNRIPFVWIFRRL